MAINSEAAGAALAILLLASAAGGAAAGSAGPGPGAARAARNPRLASFLAPPPPTKLADDFHRMASAISQVDRLGQMAVTNVAKQTGSRPASADPLAALASALPAGLPDMNQLMNALGPVLASLDLPTGE